MSDKVESGSKLPPRKNRVTSSRNRDLKRESNNSARDDTAIAISSRGILYSEPRAGYTQRWVNDRYNNIDRFLGMGWRPRLVEDSSEADLDSFSNCISRIVSPDSGMRAILMEIPQDVFDELRAKGQKEVDDIEKSLKSAPGSSVDITYK